MVGFFWWVFFVVCFKSMIPQEFWLTDIGYYLYPDITPWSEFEHLPNESDAVPPGMMDMVLPVSLWNWW